RRLAISRRRRRGSFRGQQPYQEMKNEERTIKNEEPASVCVRNSSLFVLHSSFLQIHRSPAMSPADAFGLPLNGAAITTFVFRWPPTLFRSRGPPESRLSFGPRGTPSQRT